MRKDHSIQEYGDGDMCLKEMLVNADDARASHFFVCLDKTAYPKEACSVRNHGADKGLPLLTATTLSSLRLIVRATRARSATAQRLTTKAQWENLGKALSLHAFSLTASKSLAAATYLSLTHTNLTCQNMLAGQTPILYNAVSPSRSLSNKGLKSNNIATLP